MQRPGLLLLDGVVYAGFASHCDKGPYVGFVVGVNATSGKQTAMWATETGGSNAKAGIWQSGGGLVSDGKGQIIFATGNGVSPSPRAGNKPPGQLAESVVRVAVQDDGTLKATDFFSPVNNSNLDTDDTDLGSGGPMAIPDGYGTAEHPHLLVEVGKDGRVFLLDRDDLGGSGQKAGQKDDVLQTGGPYRGVWGYPAFWGGDGGYVYMTTNRGPISAFKVGVSGSGNPALTRTGTTSPTSATPPGCRWSPRTARLGLGPRLGRLQQGPDRRGWAAAGVRRRAQQGPPDPALLGPDRDRDQVLRPGHEQRPGLRRQPVRLRLRLRPADHRRPGEHADRLRPGRGEVERDQAGPGHGQAHGQAHEDQHRRPVQRGQGQAAGHPRGGQVADRPGHLQADEPRVGVRRHRVRHHDGDVRLRPARRRHRGRAAVRPLHARLRGGPGGGKVTLDASITNSGGDHDDHRRGRQAPQGPFSTDSLPDGRARSSSAGSSVSVPISFEPTEAGKFSTTLVVKSSTGDVTVPITGTSIKGNAQLTITPGTLQFGEVQVGKSVTKKFDIKNTGNLLLTLTKAAPPTDPFLVLDPVSEGQQLEPDDVIHQSVTFAPTKEGAFDGTYSITGNDGQGAHLITVHGTAVTAPVTHAITGLGKSSTSAAARTRRHGRPAVQLQPDRLPDLGAGRQHPPLPRQVPGREGRLDQEQDEGPAVGRNGSAAQDWKVGPNSSLVNTKSARCLDAPRRGSRRNKLQLQIYNCNGSDAQRWSLDG